MSKYQDLKFKIQAEDFTTKAFKNLSNNIVGTASKFRSLRLSVANIKTIAMSAIGGFLVKSIIDAGDKIQKLNQKLNISTEALSQYKYAAESSGTSFEVFTTSIQKLNVAVSDAVNGNGQAVKVLKELEIEAGEFSKISPEKQFEVIADRLVSFSNNADKARIATKLFGDSGVELLQMMQNGSDGIRKMREEAHNFGLTLSKDDVNAMAKFNDAIARLKSSFNGLVTQLVVLLAPALTFCLDLIKDVFIMVVNKFRKSWDELGKSLNYILEDFFGLEGGLKTVAKGIAYVFEVCCNSVQKSWLAMKMTAVAVTSSLLTLSGQIMEKVSDTMNSFGVDNNFTKYLKDRGEILSQVNNGLDEYLNSMIKVADYEQTSKSFDFAKDKASGIGEKVNFRRTEYSDAEKYGNKSDTMKEYNDLLRQREQILNEIQTPEEQFIERINLVENLNQANLLTQAEYNRAFEKSLENYQNTDGITTFREGLKSIADEALNLGEILKNGMSMAIDGLASEITEFVLTGKANFLELAGSIAKMVLEMTIKLLILKTLMTALGIPTVALAKGGVFSNGANISAFTKGGIFNNGRNIKAFASGGVVGVPTLFPMSAGRTGLMGEAGPEAIMPLTRGYDGKLGVKLYNKGNKGNVETQNITNISFNVKSDNPEEFRRSQAQIEADLINAINRAKRNS